jgi:hypothetical protein
VNATRARKTISKLARERKYLILAYCALRMLQRVISERDVVTVLTRATRCWQQENGRWRLQGKDADGETLFVVVELQDAIVVVNAFKGNEEKDDED